MLFKKKYVLPNSTSFFKYIAKYRCTRKIASLIYRRVYLSTCLFMNNSIRELWKIPRIQRDLIINICIFLIGTDNQLFHKWDLDAMRNLAKYKSISRIESEVIRASWAKFCAKRTNSFDYSSILRFKHFVFYVKNVDIIINIKIVLRLHNFTHICSQKLFYIKSYKMFA